MGELDGSLRLGKIGFLNVLPVYYALEKGLIEHPFEIYEGSPSELNRMIAKGDLGISAISSLEYGCNYRKYLLIPGLSISSVGKVKSVVLFSDHPVEKLDQEGILLTNKSYTSVHLLRLLFSKFWEVNPCYIRDESSSGFHFYKNYPAVLAIGDDALKLARGGKFRYQYDLGEAWHRWTGKPFVFAVWVINKRIMASLNGHMQVAYDALMAAKKFGMEHLTDIALEASSENILPYTECLEYFKQLRYDLTDEYLEGLELFFSYLVETRLLPEKPLIHFFPGS